MRKTLLLSAIVACTVSTLQAQTVANPLTLELGGENKYEFSGGYSTPVYKYTAPEDQLVSVVANNTDATIRVTYDGTYSNLAPSYNQKNNCSFIIQKDESLYLQVTTYTSPLTIDASAKAQAYNLANTAADALEITPDADPMFVPFREEKYVEQLVYLTYLATEDGALEMTFSGYVHNAEFAEGDGAYVGLTCKASADYSTYRASIPVEEGKRYYVRLAGQKAQFLTAKIVHPVFGESADYPFIITGTTAEVPAKAGKYYYEVTGTESGYCVIGSQVTDFDGTVSFGQRIDTNMFTMADGSFDIRQRATQGGHYYIIVDKKSDTADAQQFTVSFQAAQPYDKDTEGEPVVLGDDMTIPPYAGTYYYRVSVPEGAYLLKAVAEKAFTADGSSMSIYLASNTYTAVYIGDPDIVCEVSSNTDYIIKVTVTEADKRNALKVTLSKLQQGDGASDPFIAVVGKNEISAGDSKYYLYKAEKTSWVYITPENPSINYPSVQRQKSEKYPTATYVTLLKDGNVYKFQAESGQDYLIRFTKIAEPTAFDLALVDYGKGETQEDPFIVTSSTIEVPSSPATYWWSYVPERSGKLQISTDFKFDVVSSPTRENSVALLNAAGTLLAALPIDYTEEIFNPVKVNVTEGQQYYLRIISVSEQDGKTVNFEIGDLDPGETPAVAIEITPNEVPYDYTFEKNSSNFASSKWYVIELEEGELSIYSEQSLTFRIYKENEANDYNTTNYTFYASTFWTPDYTKRYYGINKAAITVPGKYYIASYYNYSDVSAIIEGSAVKTTASVANITIDEDSNAPIEYFDLNGRKVAEPASGLYIRKQGAKVTKVMVK